MPEIKRERETPNSDVLLEHQKQLKKLAIALADKKNTEVTNAKIEVCEDPSRKLGLKHFNEVHIIQRRDEYAEVTITMRMSLTAFRNATKGILK